MEKIKQSIILAIVSLVFIGAVFFAGYYVGAKRCKDITSEFENRLEFITGVNKQLQAENSRITELNDSLSKRLDRAKSIIDGFASQVETDGDTIQRAIETVSKLEQVLSVLFESK